MRTLILRFLISAAAIAVITSGILPGITIVGNTVRTIAVVAVIFGLINAFVKPLLRFLTCPLIILTLGLFTFVLNAALLLLTASLSARLAEIADGVLVIDGFGWALVGAFVVSLITTILEGITGANGRRVEVREYHEIRYVTERQNPIIEKSKVPPESLPSAPPLLREVDYDFDDPDFGKPKRKG